MIDDSDGSPRWAAYTHEEILALVRAGPGPAASQYAAGRWEATWFTVTYVEATLAQAITDAGGGWAGQAADAMTAGTTPLGRWAGQAAAQAQATARTVEAQAGYADYTRREMPPLAHPEIPVEPGRGPRPYMSGVPIMTDWAAVDRDRDAATARARDLMETYSRNSYYTLPGMLDSQGPPPVVVQNTATGTVHGAVPGDGGAPHGPTAGAGGAAVPLGAVSGPGVAVGRAGTAQGPRASQVRSGPTGVVPAAGTLADGPGPGGSATGAGAPGSSAPGGAAGDVGSAPRGPSALEPSSGRTAAGSLTEPPLQRGPRPPGDPAGGGPTPRGPTGAVPAFDATAPRGPAGPGPLADPSAEGRPGGFAGRGTANPLPSPAVLDRGSPERPFPSSAPPTGRGVGEGMVPMGAGAMGRAHIGEHRRPHYLVDDGSAFADDRAIPTSVINEGWPRA